MSNYTANDIISLSAGRAFRDKLGMYLTGEKQEAINLGLRELIVNVQDEYEVAPQKDAFCKITLNTKTKEICVSDNARGIPTGVREDGINSLTASFLIPHSGGKHTEGAYSSAIGINGEGNKIVCHTARWLEVEVKRDNKIYFQRFESNEEGAKAVADVKETKGDQQTGTKITYVADPLVYGDIFIDLNNLRAMLKNMSYFSKGLKFILNVDGEEEIFYSTKGLIDGLSKENTLSPPFSYYYKTDDCRVELALQWVSKKGQIRGYANSLYVPQGGAFISKFKSSLTRTFNSLSKGSFSGDQIRAVLDGFVSVKVKVGQWSNQQKDSLANPEAATATSAAITACLKEFAISRKDDFNKIVELLSRLQKAEKAADKAREAVLNHTKKMTDLRSKKVAFVKKLYDAEELGEDSVLCIVEGESARNAALIGRDSKKVGVMEIRGKMINGLKSSDVSMYGGENEKGERIEGNKEIELLLYACGIDINGYNKRKLRYGKVYIFVDGDLDGSHIALLILSNFWRICPQFLRENRVCWLRAPLFIEQGKKEEPLNWWYDDKSFNKDRSNVKGNIKRVKGLGQMSEADLKATCFSTNGGQQVDTIEYTEEGIEQLCSLMGIEVAPRKEFVMGIDFSDYGAG